ncbi:MAG: hypothetical protein OHK0032_12980 [Thermodesulfovibrionales bacterium]
MPIYEYICMKCNNSFSVLQKIGFSEKDTICPECGSTDVKKKVSLFCSSTSAGGSFSASSSLSGFGGGGG